MLYSVDIDRSPPVLGGKVTVQFNEMRPSMPQIQTNKQPLTQITIVESEPEKQAEALRVMTERAASWRASRVSSPSVCIAAWTGAASSTTYNGRTAICC